MTKPYPWSSQPKGTQRIGVPAKETARVLTALGHEDDFNAPEEGYSET